MVEGSWWWLPWNGRAYFGALWLWLHHHAPVMLWQGSWTVLSLFVGPFVKCRFMFGYFWPKKIILSIMFFLGQNPQIPDIFLVPRFFGLQFPDSRFFGPLFPDSRCWLQYPQWPGKSEAVGLIQQRSNISSVYTDLIKSCIYGANNYRFWDTTPYIAQDGSRVIFALSDACSMLVSSPDIYQHRCLLASRATPGSTRAKFSHHPNSKILAVVS